MNTSLRMPSVLQAYYYSINVVNTVLYTDALIVFTFVSFFSLDIDVISAVVHEMDIREERQYSINSAGHISLLTLCPFSKKSS